MTETLLSESNTEIDPSKDYLSMLVGPDAKFKDPQELARGKYEADLYIDTIIKQKDDQTREILELRSELNTRAKLEEMIDQINQKQQTFSSTLPEAKDNPKPFDPKETESIFDRKLQEYEESKKAKENFQQVQLKLREQYGNGYANVLKDKMVSLHLTEDYVNDLARRSPDAFLKLMDLDENRRQDTFQSPPRSAQRPDQFAPKTRDRTWTFYEDMKKKDPNAYWNPKTQVQMHQDLMQLGDKFKDGDYKRFAEPYNI